MLLCRGAVHKNLNSALPNLRIFASCSCLHLKLRPGYRYQQYEITDLKLYNYLHDEFG